GRGGERGGGGRGADARRAGRFDEIARDRGDRARAAGTGREHHGKLDRPRGVEQGKLGAPARESQHARRPGAPQAVDDDVGDGGAARHFFAKLSKTGRMRSSAFFRLASEFAYENLR